jgi:hypothetical protein
MLNYNIKRWLCKIKRLRKVEEILVVLLRILQGYCLYCLLLNYISNYFIIILHFEKLKIAMLNLLVFIKYFTSESNSTINLDLKFAYLKS